MVERATTRHAGAALLVMAMAAALLLLAATPAAALPAPTASRATIVERERVTISGTGCLDVPGAPVPTVAVSNLLLGADGRGSADASGAWSLSLPFDFPGVMDIVVVCRLSTGDVPYPPVTVVVDIAPVPVPAGPTPATSAPPTPPSPPFNLPWRGRSPLPVPSTPGTYTAQPSPPPRTTARTPAAGSATPSPALGPAPAAPSTPVAAPRCSDCALLAGGRPVAAGQDLSLAYSGFQPGELITVVMRSAPVTLGTFTADPSGTVTAAVELPDDAESGAHTLTFSGPLSGDLVVVPFRVEASERTVTATAEQNASHGGISRPWLVGGGLAALLLAAGGALLFRRRTAHSGHPEAEEPLPSTDAQPEPSPAV